MKTIFINKEKRYLSDELNELPSNCIFDKGKVGCGGTSIAIESVIPYVICVPFNTLIENKTYQYPNDRYQGKVLGVDGNTTKKEVISYLDEVEIPKIMVTYDSLGKLTSWINPSEFKILIDEMHILFTQYSFRQEAAKIVLSNYQKYKEFCFITATVLEPEFLLDELTEIPIVTAEWEDVKEVNVVSVKCKNSVSATTAQLIKEFLDGTKTGNAYFFCNSVEFIREMVSVCELTNENTIAIWSKNNKAEVGLNRGTTIDCNTNPRKINFLTSTAFEGSDIYDEEGRIIIVSDNRKPHTLTDISTSFQQIAGRIRNSKYWADIYHLYTNTRYDIECTYDEFKAKTTDTIIEAKDFVNKLNSYFTPKQRASLHVGNEKYVNKIGEEFIFDPNLVKIDLYNFKITKSLYRLRVNIQDEYKKYGYNVTGYTHDALDITRMDFIDKRTFKEVCEELEKNFDTNLFTFTDNDKILAPASVRYPFIREAINKLGFEGIKECGYVITNIKYKLDSLSYSGNENKILNMLKTKLDLSNGTFVTSKKLKETIQLIYNELGISKTAKGSDIDNYFESKSSTKTINGKSVKGYIIIRSKVVLTKLNNE
jgi:hypothetical protein